MCTPWIWIGLYRWWQRWSWPGAWQPQQHETRKLPLMVTLILNMQPISASSTAYHLHLVLLLIFLNFHSIYSWEPSISPLWKYISCHGDRDVTSMDEIGWHVQLWVQSAYPGVGESVMARDPPGGQSESNDRVPNMTTKERHPTPGWEVLEEGEGDRSPSQWAMLWCGPRPQGTSTVSLS